MKPIIYPEAGKLVLVNYKPDGSLEVGADTLIGAIGTVQSIATSITFNTSELADGNSNWPMGVYDTGQAGQVEVTMSSFQPKLYAALIGSDLTKRASDVLWAADEGHTIPEESPYRVTLAHEVNDSIVVLDEEGSPMVSTSSTPAKGSYTVSADTLTFNSADAGRAVFVTYDWTAEDVETLAMPETVRRPAMHAILSGIVTDEDEVRRYAFEARLDKVKATGDIAPPPQQREPQPWSFTLQILKPRPGRDAVSLKYSPLN